jgi:hypothetical protein
MKQLVKIITFLVGMILFTSCLDDLSHATTIELVNNRGQKIEQTFSNEKRNLILVFQNNEIILNKDTIAIGESYSNKNYSFTNIHGTITLKKGDTILFIHKQ